MFYFDHNATHPVSHAAQEAWRTAVQRFIGNPSSPHRHGARAEKALDDAREKLAAWLGCHAGDIVWTSGATEANNMAVHHLAARPGAAWVSAIEHPCLLEATRRHFPERRRLLPAAGGVVDPAALRAALQQERPALVAVMAANNETGIVQPWREIGAVCREFSVPFLCDAAQWIGRRPARGLGACDFVSGCAHKSGGPQGVGFLKCPPETRALLVGGPQEEGRRAGTENVAGVLAMIAALEACEQNLEDGLVEWQRTAVRHQFEQELLASVPGLEIVGATLERLWNTTAVIMPEQEDCRQRWVVRLDKAGYAVSTGSACASGKEQPSHVLSAMGYTPAQAGRALRFSSGWETSAEHWAGLRSAIETAARELSGAGASQG